MDTSTSKLSRLPTPGLTESILRRVAYSICTILSVEDPLKVFEIQAATKFERETVLFSIGRLVRQGVVSLQGKMDDFELQLAVERRIMLGQCR